MRKVCFVADYNLYETKRYFAKMLVEALQRQNLEVLCLDPILDGSEASLLAIQLFSPDVVCTFNSVRSTYRGGFWWDYFSIPYFSILLEPACYSLDLLRSPLSIISCVDRQDIATMQAINFKRAFFFPHAVERELSPDPHLEKKYEVAFFGSCYDYESMRIYWGGIIPIWTSRVIDDAIGIVFLDDTISLDQALRKACEASPQFQKEVKADERSFSYRCLDYYTRGKDRIELIRSIKNAHVHVFGELKQGLGVEKKGWSHYLAGQSNVTLHPPVPFAEALQIMKQSKIVLNSMPYCRDGSHERVFAALACGALPVSSESKFLREEFCAGKEIEFYQAAHRADISERIDALLSNEPQRQAAVASGREKVMQRHTWDHRAELLMSVLPQLIESKL